MTATADEDLPGGLAYFEWCAAPGDDLDDVHALARANPALGTRLSLGFITGVERQDLTDEEFRAERLGIWVETTTDEPDRVIPAEPWARHCDPAQAAQGTVAFAVDAAPDLAWASIGVSDGRCVEIVENRPGGAWLPRRLAALVKRWQPATVVIDPHGPAAALVERIEAAKVTLRPVTTQEYRRACAVFLAAVTDDTDDDSDDARQLWHRDQPVLDAAVAGATRRTIGDGWGWARRDTSIDISPLVVATLAYWAAHAIPAGRPTVAGPVDEDAYARALAQIEEDEARAYQDLDLPPGP